MYHFAIIGAGLIGAAAARHLSRISDSVALIGPAEPDNWAAHHGPFASHYDQGRITRALDSDPFWARWAQASIDRYRKIESTSGLSFYYPVGSIQVGLDTAGGYIDRTAAIGRDGGVDFQRYSAAEFARLVPEMRLPAGRVVLHEPHIGGYINPRELIAAQLKLATGQGAVIIRDAAVSLRETSGGMQIELAGREVINAQTVLVTAGAWTEWLLGRHLGLSKRPRTVLLARLSESEAGRLSRLPSVVFYEGVHHPALTGVYSLPPIRYPDGRVYLKIGGKMAEPPEVSNPADLVDWFHSDGSQEEAAALKEELLAMVPGLQAEAWVTRPCVVTYTAANRPVMEELVPGRLYVAAGGCGSAAKSSDELGRLAAEMANRRL